MNGTAAISGSVLERLSGGRVHGAVQTPRGPGDGDASRVVRADGGRLNGAGGALEALRAELVSLGSVVRDGGGVSDDAAFTRSIAEASRRFNALVGEDLSGISRGDDGSGGATPASLVLRFGDNGGVLNLGGVGGSYGADELFAFRVEGATGDIELNFSSGTTLEQVADTINSFSGKTGVGATLEVDDSTGARHIILTSSDAGSDAFVGVKMLDDGEVAAGDLAGPAPGIYRVGDDGTIDPDSGVAFDQLGAVVGQGSDGDDAGGLAGWLDGALAAVNARLGATAASDALVEGGASEDVARAVRSSVLSGESGGAGALGGGESPAPRVLSLIGGRVLS